MYAPPSSACNAPDFLTDYPRRQRAECVYRGITLAAMFLLLASLWVF
jgi:hypothetical protein